MVTQGISMMFTSKSSPSLMRETLKTFIAEHDDELRDHHRRRRANKAKPAGRRRS